MKLKIKFHTLDDLNYDTEMPATNNWTSITNLYDSRVYYARWNSGNYMKKNYI